MDNLTIERCPLDSLMVDPKNARKHDKKNLESIKGSLKRFGQAEPLVVQKSTNRIIGGNGRIEAMKALGWTHADCVLLDVDDKKAKALAIALNRTAELADWNLDILSDVLSSLKDDFDLGEIGFDESDLAKFIIEEPKQGLIDDDEIPDNVETRCKSGDLWILGDHRLLCGDSTDVLQVERLMGGEKADMVFTDPPYGIDLDTSYQDLSKAEHGHAKTRSKNNFTKIEGDNCLFNPDFLLGFFKDIKEIFLWGANYYALGIHDYYNGSWVVWDKRGTEELDKMFGSQFELCWSKSKHRHEIARVTWSSFFGHSKKDDGEKKVHPTMKPVKLIEWFFERWGKSNDLVVDLFLGSGSTLIACEKTGRKCRGSEIDPHYCSVVLERWEKFSGKKAVLHD